MVIGRTARWAAALCLLIASAGADAAVFKCELPGGKHEYRGTPCKQGEGELFNFNDPTQRSENEADKPSAGSLQGTWCEFGVSADKDGDIDSSAQAEWSFLAERVRYRLKTADAYGPDMNLRRDGQEFFVDHPMFGGGSKAWVVVGRREGRIVVEGPMGGFYHFRPGGC